MINSRKGFSLLVAIFTIVLVSVVASYIFYASSSISKEGSLEYQQEQARLLARSYTEYAVLAITGNDRSTGKCIRQIKADIGFPDGGQGYKVEVDVTYIANHKYIDSCPSADTPKAVTLSDNGTDTVTVILDVYVKYTDATHPGLDINNPDQIPWHTYHKRSLQKIWELKKPLQW